MPYLPLFQKLCTWDWSGHLSHKVDLAGRSQFVSIDGNSTSLPALSGVPQGSVLGPLLFVSYINDVATATSSDSDVNMFADHVALYRVIRTRADYIHLQEDVNSVSTCIGQKFLHFNTITSANWCSLHGRGLTPYLHLPWPWTGQYTEQSFQLAINTWVSQLALTCHAWSPHIINCCNKTSRLIGFLYRCFYQHTNNPSLLRLYKSFIRPHLDVASIVWNPHLRMGFWIQWTAQSCQSSTPAWETSSIKHLSSIQNHS